MFLVDDTDLGITTLKMVIGAMRTNGVIGGVPAE